MDILFWTKRLFLSLFVKLNVVVLVLANIFLFLGKVWIFVTIHYKTAPLSSDVFNFMTIWGQTIREENLRRISHIQHHLKISFHCLNMMISRQWRKHSEVWPLAEGFACTSLDFSQWKSSEVKWAEWSCQCLYIN